MVNHDQQASEGDMTDKGISNHEGPAGPFGRTGSPNTERTAQNYTPEPTGRHIAPPTGRPGATRRV